MKMKRLWIRSSFSSPVRPVTPVIILLVFLNIFQASQGSRLNCYYCITAQDGVVRSSECLNVANVQSITCEDDTMNFCAKSTFLLRLGVGDFVEFKYRLMVRHCMPIPTSGFSIDHACMRMRSLNLTALKIKLPGAIESRSGKRIDYDANPMTYGMTRLGGDPNANANAHSPTKDSSARQNILQLLTPKIVDIRSCVCKTANCNNSSGFRTDRDDKCLPADVAHVVKPFIPGLVLLLLFISIFKFNNFILNPFPDFAHSNSASSDFR